ncbi:MAG: Uncharacterised protein [Cryomorphaceae bacterium]|nr:MAG: Uncharacterised protein [Cryomorphaceae bacterium]
MHGPATPLHKWTGGALRKGDGPASFHGPFDIFYVFWIYCTVHVFSRLTPSTLDAHRARILHELRQQSAFHGFGGCHKKDVHFRTEQRKERHPVVDLIFCRIEHLIHGAHICEIRLVVGHKQHTALRKIFELISTYDLNAVETEKSVPSHETKDKDDRPFDQ